MKKSAVKKTTQKPAKKAVAKPPVKTAAKPAAKSAARPAVKPAARPAPKPAVKAAATLGYTVGEDKRSQQVLPSHMQAADMIFVMDAEHKRQVSGRMPVATGKTFLLGHWEKREIPDPIGQSEEFFIEIINQLDVGCMSWVKQIRDMGLAR